MADARGVGSTLADIRTRSAKRAKQANRGCPLLALLDRHADIRTLVLRPANLGLVMLWRLKCVSRTWGAWVTAAMRSLPDLIVQGGREGRPQGGLVYQLSFATMRWTPLASTASQRHSHMACSTPDGNIVLAGGSEVAELPNANDHALPLGGSISAETRGVEVYCGGAWSRSDAPQPGSAGLPTLPVPLADGPSPVSREGVRKGQMVCLPTQDGGSLLLALGGLVKEYWAGVMEFAGELNQKNVVSAEVWSLRLDGQF